MMKGMAADCKEKEGATDADVDDMIAKNMPSTKPAKCLTACMMDQFGVVRMTTFKNIVNIWQYGWYSFQIADGKFSPEGLVEVAKLATENDEEKVKVAGEIADECKDVTDADR